jgi:low affinity Fe/Cu permease
MEARFSRFARATSLALGKPQAFALACLVVIVWAATGPMFGYSDTWQLMINTGTTIITFLMVFLLQHTQNRDTSVIQFKLDALLRANESARDVLLGLENLTDDDLRRIQAAFATLASLGKERNDAGGATRAVATASGDAAGDDG